jgi:hypothetical protein
LVKDGRSAKALRPLILGMEPCMSDFIQRLFSRSDNVSGVVYGVIAAALSALIYAGAAWFGGHI